jgi:hypothetical protein
MGRAESCVGFGSGFGQVTFGGLNGIVDVASGEALVIDGGCNYEDRLVCISDRDSIAGGRNFTSTM